MWDQIYFDEYETKIEFKDQNNILFEFRDQDDIPLQVRGPTMNLTLKLFILRFLQLNLFRVSNNTIIFTKMNSK